MSLQSSVVGCSFPSSADDSTSQSSYLSSDASKGEITTISGIPIVLFSFLFLPKLQGWSDHASGVGTCKMLDDLWI